MDDALKSLGELFIIGFEGTELSDETSAFLSQARIGGVILFKHNYESPEQVATLINQVQECRGDLPLWISVDQEGGRVQRFKEPFTIIPPAMLIGDADSPKLAFEIADVMAKELRAVGVNLNFCPVADIMTNPDNPVIGDRAYGTDEDRVSKLVTAMVRGHLTNGVQACVKHFPGHGDTSIDSHLDLPSVDTPLEVLREREFRPFVKASKSRCAILMTAHVVVKSIDPDVPATFSKKIVTDILRNELRYSRVVITDDMEMGAVTKHFGAEQAPVLAIQAGCDLMCYRTEAAARHAYESVRKALESGELSPERVIESAERSRKLKADTLLPYEPADPKQAAAQVGLPESRALVAQIAPSI